MQRMTDKERQAIRNLLAARVALENYCDVYLNEETHNALKLVKATLNSWTETYPQLKGVIA